MVYLYSLCFMVSCGKQLFRYFNEFDVGVL